MVHDLYSILTIGKNEFFLSYIYGDLIYNVIDIFVSKSNEGYVTGILIWQKLISQIYFSLTKRGKRCDFRQSQLTW
jgi:hypothetical protein